MKNLIFYATMTYIILILILLGINFFNRTEFINFDSNPDYEKKIKILENRINSYENNECIGGIQSLIKKSKDTYFSGKVFLKDLDSAISSNDEYWISLYGKAIDKCNINNNDINTYALTVVTIYEDLRLDYAFEYELTIPDFENRFFLQPSYINMNERIRKDMEIKTISALLNEVEK